MPVGPLSNILVPIVILGSVVGLIWGITTSGQSYPDAKLNREFEMETATPARRLGGSLLDGVLFWLTLVIGWFIWFAIVAPRGQTPGKSLVSTYVIREDGTRASGGFMWMREILIKVVLFFITGLFLAGLARLVASLWCLWDADKQCGWDKMMNSYVAFAPYGEPVPGEGVASIGASGPAQRLRELQQLREDGIITTEEYEERRQRLVEHL